MDSDSSNASDEVPPDSCRSSEQISVSVEKNPCIKQKNKSLVLSCQIQKSPEFGDYKTLLRNSIQTISSLKKELEKKQIFLSDKELEDIRQVVQKYPMSINPYYFSLIKSKNDPIWNQCIPKVEEITDVRGEEDPLKEENKIPCLTHRYPDRCLILISNSCGMYCRFCTRKRKVGEIQKNPTLKNIKDAFDYVRNHPEIRDVIFSGGDPFLLSDNILKSLLVILRKIPHIEIIRFGTRVPCTLPQRITPELCKILRQNNKNPALYINTHFEHPDEITEESKKACEMLADAGIPLGNQSVILKGVNDSPGIFKELNRKLLSIKVKPYYIYQPDLIRGTYHFIGSVRKGIEIIKELRGHTSGLAVPHFVIDCPGGGGKIPIIPKYATINEDGSINLNNYQDKEFFYPCIK